MVSLKSSPLQKYTQLGTIFRKIVFHYQSFFLLPICSLLDCLANTWKKIGGHRVRLREKENLSAIELSLRDISYFLYVHALMCAR